jgi:predicted  nucleic acid-binding Zn-ribbon protein
MPGTLNTRVTSLEESMRRVFTALDALTEKEKRLNDVLVLLTEAQIATQQSFQETDRRFQETDRRIEALAQKLTESHLQLDERIKNLVSAIGDFIRTRQ